MKRLRIHASGLSGMSLNMRSTTEASFPWLSEHMAWKVSIPRDQHSALRLQKHWPDSFCTRVRERAEQANHRHLDQRLTGLHLSFIILAHSPVARDPTEGALHHPSA